MAGGHALKSDQGYQAYNSFQSRLPQLFRFTKTAAKTVLLYAVIAPLALGYVGYKYQGKIDFVGNFRSKPLYKDEYAEDLKAIVEERKASKQ